MKKKLFKLLMVTVVVCLPLLSAWAQTEIRTVTDLNNVRSGLTGSYKLMNDIDMSDVTDWEPIGMSADHVLGSISNFTGTFDGQGFAIKNLTYTYTGTGVTGGIFARITGTVKNLELRNLTITGTNTSAPDKNCVGALAAALGQNSNVSQISVIGCTLTGNSDVGGIVGRTVSTNQTISNSFVESTTKIIGAASVGGLIGNLNVNTNAKITNCYVAATMECTSSATIYGLVGNSTTTAANANLTSTFVMAQAIAGTNLVPFAPIITSSANYFACSDYFPSVDPANAKTLQELKEEVTYTGVGWDFDGAWTWDNSGENVFPVLFRGELPEWYEISTIAQLRAIGNSTTKLGRKYKLTADLDFADVTDWLPIGVTETTGSDPGDTYSFYGTFDGQGHTLSNIKIRNTGRGFTGALFTKLGTSAGAPLVKNLVLENVDIEGGNCTGGLCGTVFTGVSGATATIQNVYVSGKITGTGEVGGITGRCNNPNAILIKDCSVDAVITATDAITTNQYQGAANTVSTHVNVGGIAGAAITATNVTIENCLVQGKIVAAKDVATTLCPGGLFGYARLSAAIINLKNSVVAAEIEGGTNAFWGNNISVVQVDQEATMNVSSCYALDNMGLTNQTGGTLAPLADLQTESLYKTTLGWDFEDIWQIQEGKFPIFKWQEYPECPAPPALFIESTEIKTKEDYLTGGYGDIIFKSDDASTGQLIIPEGETLTVNGVVKLQKTFIPGQWYPIGFPFDVDAFYCDDLKEDGQGNNGVLDIYSKEADQGDFWVKEYKGTTNLFDYVTRIESGKGYIIQFPPAFEDNEVTFISVANPVLKNTTALPAELTDNAYTLVANPSTANVSSIEGASHYYLYNSTDNQFSLLEGTAPALKPFEALIVVKNPVTPLREIYVKEQGTGCKPINTGDQLLETRYYSLQGIEIPKPEANGIFIAKKIYTSGKVEIVKTCVNKK